MLEPDVLPRLRRQGRIGGETVLDEADVDSRRPWHDHAAGGVPCRPRRQRVALDEHDVAPSGLREMVGDGTAGDTTADDNHAGLAGQVHVLSRPVMFQRTRAAEAYDL